MTLVPSLFHGLCDDAALFPPGNAPMPDAVPAHARHLASGYAALVGPFVAPATRIGELITEISALGSELDLSLTAPGGAAQLASAQPDLAGDNRIALRAVEVALPAEASVDEFFTELAAVPLDPGVDVYVEVPRDERRAAVLDAIAAAGVRAKFRTGGIRADLYPSEAELAESIRGAVERDIAFKATAGLHHAIRNTDPRTGFEQHGFLNLLLAAANPADAETLLAVRDRREITARVRDLDPATRARFVSYGTCSVLDPVTDLIDLHLLPAQVHTEGVRA
ncbi:MAG TPA: hypothetical protein VIW24_12675 [Aldersonia sp.]